jgi:hypothetical protein
MELELLDPKKEFKINEYFRAVLYNSSIRIKFLKEINLARNMDGGILSFKILGDNFKIIALSKNFPLYN